MWMPGWVGGCCIPREACAVAPRPLPPAVPTPCHGPAAPAAAADGSGDEGCGAAGAAGLSGGGAAPNPRGRGAAAGGAQRRGHLAHLVPHQQPAGLGLQRRHRPASGTCRRAAAPAAAASRCAGTRLRAARPPSTSRASSGAPTASSWPQAPPTTPCACSAERVRGGGAGTGAGARGCILLCRQAPAGRLRPPTRSRPRCPSCRRAENHADGAPRHGHGGAMEQEGRPAAVRRGPGMPCSRRSPGRACGSARRCLARHPGTPPTRPPCAPPARARRLAGRQPDCVGRQGGQPVEAVYAPFAGGQGWSEVGWVGRRAVARSTEGMCGQAVGWRWAARQLGTAPCSHRAPPPPAPSRAWWTQTGATTPCLLPAPK